MSYLLKALQKAEAERKAAQEAETLPVQADATAAKLPLSLLLVVLLLLILVAYSVIKPVRTDGEPVALIKEDEAAIEAQAPMLPSVNAVAEPVVTKVVTSQGLQEAESETDVLGAPAVGAAVSADARSGAQSVEPVELMALTAQQLAQLPSIRFQSHIFSSAADYRSVVINDRTLKQGSLLASGVRVAEITPQGLVLDIQGTLVALPKGQDWIAPAK